MILLTPAENWWLLIACGVLEASIAAIYLVMACTDGPVVAYLGRDRGARRQTSPWRWGRVRSPPALWGARDGRSRPLVLNGVASPRSASCNTP